MTDEQERAEFEAWLGVKPCCGAGHDLAWEAWQARAALRSQDREGDDLKEVGKQAVRWAPSSAYWSAELARLFGPDAREGINVLEARLASSEQRELVLREEVLRLRVAMAKAAQRADDWPDSNDDPADVLSDCASILFDALDYGHTSA